MQHSGIVLKQCRTLSDQVVVAYGAQFMCMAICHDAMAMDMATPRPLHWLWLYPQPLPWDLASIALLRVLFLCNLLGICMVDDGGGVFRSLRLDMGRLA